jgi:hypothetical protein
MMTSRYSIHQLLANREGSRIVQKVIVPAILSGAHNIWITSHSKDTNLTINNSQQNQFEETGYRGKSKLWNYPASAGGFAAIVHSGANRIAYPKQPSRLRDDHG